VAKQTLLLISMFTVLISCEPYKSAEVNLGSTGENESGFDQPVGETMTYEKAIATHKGFIADAITRLYRGILQRDPDEGGFKSHFDFMSQNPQDGWAKLLTGFPESDEFKNEIQSKKTALEILTAMYEGLLGPNRALDPSGQETYLPLIQDEQYGAVALALGTSEEFYSKVYPFPGLSPSRARTAITKAYRAILGRDPDEGGLAAHSEYFLAKNMRGWFDVLNALSGSNEFKQNVWGKKTPDEILNQLYRGFFDRDADPSGHDSYIDLVKDKKIGEVAFVLGTSDEFFERLGKILPQKREGLVRLNGRTLVDDSGEFNALGATLFSAARWYKFNRPRLEKQLQTLKDNGFDYIRAIGTVAWPDREIDPRWPDYRQVIEGLTDFAYDKYGLRVQWTIFGDAQLIAPTYTERRRIVEMFLDVSKTRQQKIIMFEIANEHWANGFSGEEGRNQLIEFARYLNDRTPILVATSAAGGSNCEAFEAINPAGATDVGMMHFERTINEEDGPWRPVRQPWEYLNCKGPVAGDNNEPIGPGSSVACESDPMRMAMAAVTTYNSGLPFYVFHSRVGVGAGDKCGLNGDDDMANMPAINAFVAMKSFMPPGSSGWNRHDYTSYGNPIILYGDGVKFKTTTEGAQNGCMSNFASTKGDEFVSGPIGCRGTVKLEARFNLFAEVIHPLTGDVIRTVSLKAGESFDLNGLTAYVIKGTYTGGGGEVQCSGAPIDILRCHRARFGTPMQPDDLINFLRASARDFNRNNVEGGPYGILRKVSGRNCQGYSCDVICAGQGSSQKQWDVLISSEGAGTPTWGSPLPEIRIDTCVSQ